LSRNVLLHSLLIRGLRIRFSNTNYQETVFDNTIAAALLLLMTMTKIMIIVMITITALHKIA